MTNNITIKNLFYIISAFFVVLALPMVISAATFSLEPSKNKIAPGETFTVTVYVNPKAGEEITVAKLSTIFTPSLVEVVSFVQAAGWMSLQQPGFDALDNTNGILLKTGGFPDRVVNKKEFGLITLKAKKEGSGTLTVAGDSLLLDTENNDKQTFSKGSTFIIAKPVVVVTPPTPKVVVVTPPVVPEPQIIETPEVVVEAEPVEEPILVVEEIKVPETQIATIAETEASATLMEQMKQYWYLILIIFLIIGGLLLWRKEKN